VSDRRDRLRRTFEEVPELYDRARPPYPAAVFDDLVSLAGLAEGGRVLEIGCGTGLATVGLAERGLEVVCVELGSELAAVARRNLAAFPHVEIVNADFETWEPEQGGFDAVVAFTAFHWIDPAVRYEKPARLLREDGALAVVATHHVRTEDGEPFWTEMQEDYDAVVPGPDNRPMPYAYEIDDLGPEIEASGVFRNVALRSHQWQVTYTADAYIAVIDTYSAHRKLDPETRRQLYDRIQRRIEALPERTVTKTYLVTLNVARRL
jgi:cyclopropane fatty-acyl-phospholipid synthase-like methyltransferase